MNIRKATPDDVTSISRLERESPTAAHWSEQRYPELFVAQGGLQTLTLLAEVDKMGNSTVGASGETQVVGFLIARHVGLEWDLENIVVAPSARRTGIGKRLMEAFLNAAREANSQAVFLEVRESNAAARALYQKLGFRETGRRKSYYTNPLEDATLYSLSLP